MLEKEDIKKESDVTRTDDVIDDVREKAMLRMSRRRFVQMAGIAAGALALGNLGLIRTSYAQVPQIPLPGSKIMQFKDPLPLLSVSAGTMQTVLPSALGGTDNITLRMVEAQTNMMPTGFVPANGLPYTGTWVFRYVADPGTGIIGGANPDTYIGPAIVAVRGMPTQVRYVNNLTANNIHWRDWIDQSLHWANPTVPPEPMMLPNGTGNPAKYMGPVPAVAHLHGGEVPAAIDGGPEGWFLSNEAIPGTWTPHGAAYYAGTDVVGSPPIPAAPNESIYRYPNSQEAAPIWFHDHLLGGTRINATFAGLAGAYPIIDPGFALPAGLHPVGLQGTGAGDPVRYTVPLAIQDRMFDTNGQLFFPNVGINPDHPYWVPEFVGDTIVVNGKVWPFLNVDRQRYRFFLINGANSRPYDMFLIDRVSGVKGPRMWVIATDGGYLDAPVLIDPNATGAQKKAGVQKSLMMMPGERYEIIVDFADAAWLALINAAYAAMGIPVPNSLNLTLRNTAPTVMGPSPSGTTGRIMEFRVSAALMPADTSYDPASGILIRTGTNAPLFDNQKIKRLVNPTTGTLAAGVTVNKTRLLTLNEIAGAGGPLEVLVNNSKWIGKRSDGTQIPGSTLVNGNWNTELPNEGDTEVWEIANMTVDSHPIHLHGVQFQILNREAFNAAGYSAAYAAAFPGSATIIDPMTGLPYAAGVFIPAFGPPLDYNTGNPQALGGNPPIGLNLSGVVRPPLAYEAGWKDTAIMKPGEVTRIVVRFMPQDVPVGTAGSFSFDPSAPSSNGQPGYYVFHCHITDHEDNEMMRPDKFQPKASAVRTYIQNTDY